MKKSEFLLKLQQNLKGLPQTEIDERVDFYNEMISDAMDDGMTEEEAVMAAGDVNQVSKEIVSNTPLMKIVKEKMKPKRNLKGFEIALLILGFPLWFPLLMVAFALFLTAYILIWTLVIICYATVVGMAASVIAGIVAFFAEGCTNLVPLGCALMGIGGAVLMTFASIYVTKGTLVITKKFLLWIKSWFVGKEK